MGRPKRPVEEIMVNVPLKVLPEIEEEIDGIARSLERSKSFISRKLLMRGLLAYRLDGNLEGLLPPDSIKHTVRVDGEGVSHKTRIKRKK